MSSFKKSAFARLRWFHARYFHIPCGEGQRQQFGKLYWHSLRTLSNATTNRCFRAYFSSNINDSSRKMLRTNTCSCRENSYTPKDSSAEQTIYALSSGNVKCAVAVIRVSGEHAGGALCKLTRMKMLPEPRKAVLRTLYHPITDEPLDRALLLWFPGPHSFTGEDCCELHVHGGTSVVAAVLTALDVIPGLRHAEPGEYTQRAFLHGKLDLPEVEGLADLIHAETEAQRQQAFRQMGGDLSRLYNRWRQTLLKCAASVAAYIDFSEDELIEDGVLTDVHSAVETLRWDILRHLDDNRRGERLRDGVHVAIIGEPNVGKSTILNAICQRPAAIVSPLAGTTRDVVETSLNIAGYPVLLSDTAGLREAENEVEQEGVRRARIQSANADLRVLVIDVRLACEVAGQGENVTLRLFLKRHLAALGLFDKVEPHNGSSQGGPHWTKRYGDVKITTNSVSVDDGEFWKRTLVVLNKCDLVGAGMVKRVVDSEPSSSIALCALSCVTDEGMDGFLQALTSKVKMMCGNPLTGSPTLTHARHRMHLSRCEQALEAYLKHTDLVLAGEELNNAVRQMGKLTGKITSEEILDVVFSDFCIGK